MTRTAAYSPISIALTTVAGLVVAYVFLIAVVMSYAALTIEFTQSVRTDEGAVATLETSYLAKMQAITSIDYSTEGYTKPSAVAYVPSASVTALR